MIAPYAYHAPSSVAEALKLLAELGDDAHVMAGGTSLVLLMKQGLVKPDHVVGLRMIPELKGISRGADGWLSIAALATHREAECSPQVADHCPALAKAFSQVATVRIRNQATVGGNLAHADPAQDPPPMLLALDARVRIASATVDHEEPLDGFFRDFFETALQPGELLTEVRVPPVPPGARATYVKFLPGSQDDYATVSVAAVLATDMSGVCTHARLGLGAVAPTPLRAVSAENLLLGRKLNASIIAHVADEAARISDPLDDIRGSATYKRKMVRVITARALTELTQSMNGKAVDGTV